jgi:hypothetical protein
MDTEEFSKAMEEAYKEALRNADVIIANAQHIRHQAEQELAVAKEKVKQAEQESEKKAQQYFEGRQDQFREAARLELLRNLTRKHLETGKSVEDISLWLRVPVEFVQHIDEVLKRVSKIRNQENLPTKGNPRLRYENKGPGGTIYFENGQTSFSMWWEFAGDDAVAIVAIPTVEQWQQLTDLPLEERTSVLNFIGEQVVRDQLSGNGSFVIGESVITYYKN